MSRRSIRHGGVVACDMPECPETFVTYSTVTIARKQAAQAGWVRIKASSVALDGGAQAGHFWAERGPVPDAQAGSADGR